MRACIQVFVDELHEALILRHEQRFSVVWLSDIQRSWARAQGLPAASTGSPPSPASPEHQPGAVSADTEWRATTLFSDSGHALSVRLSPDRLVVAVQRSGTKVSVLHIASGGVVEVTCRNKRGNFILTGGVLWCDSEHDIGHAQADPSPVLVLVTTQGLEYHRLYLDRGTSRMLRHIAKTVHRFWYLPQRHFLLLSTEKSGLEMRGYFLVAPAFAPSRTPRFQLASPPSDRGVALLLLYGHVVCACVDTSEGAEGAAGARGEDPGSLRGPRLVLYELASDAALRTHLFPLYTPGEYVVAALDNVVCVHNVTARVSMVFDVGAAHVVGEAPILPPLPVQVEPVQEAPAAAGSVGAANEVAAGSAGAARVAGALESAYAAHWRLLPCGMWLHGTAQRVFVQRLMLPLLARSISQPLHVVHFLIRRTERARSPVPPHRVLLHLLLQLCREHMELSLLRLLLDALAEAYVAVLLER